MSPTWTRAAALVLAAAVAGRAAASAGLVTRSSHEASFTVRVPADWRYRDATYPSDHSTERWVDPADARSRLEVDVSGCVGCVERPSCTLRNVGCGPDPAAVVPPGTISKRSRGRWVEEFVARTPGSPYLDRGLVVIRHDGAEIRDWVYVQLWLPASRAPLAAQMLAGFSLR